MGALDALLGEPEEQPKTSKASALDALLEQSVDFMTGYTRSLVGQGAGLGFGDEAEAGIRSVIPGQGSYDENLGRIRGEIKQFGQDHPYIATGTELAGAMIPAIASRGRTAPQSLARATGQNIATGAGYGAGYGFGTGEGAEDRLSQAGISGLLGGAVGGAATPLVQAGVWAGQRLAQPMMNRIRAIANPEREAARSVATAIDVDRRVGSGGLTNQGTAIARQQTGQPIMNMDQGGEVTRRLARSAANQSPEAGATLHGAIDDRFQGQGERITTWLRTRTGATGEASTTRENLTQQARRANRPAYQAAYAAGDRGVWSENLERLTGSPDVLQAMKSAATTGKGRAVNDGFGQFNPGVRFNQQDILEFVPNAQGQRTHPNLQFWDYTKRELDDAANAARRAGRNEEASRISESARQLRDELDNIVPEYRGARQGAAQFFQAEDALEAGQNFINLNVDIADARRALARFSSAERALFQEGFVSSLMDKVNRIDDRANVIRRIWGSAKSRDQIRMVLGPQRANEFEAFMGIEQVMDAARGSMGNSTTARQLVELGLASGAGAGVGGYSAWSGADPWSAAGAGVLAAVLVRGGRGLKQRAVQQVDESVARRIATMLTSDDPNIYRQGLQIVGRSQRMMQNLRSYLGAASGIGASQSELNPSAPQ